MDIAKIRKKFKEAEQGVAKPGPGSGEESGKEEKSACGPVAQTTEKQETEIIETATSPPEEAADSVIELLTFTLAGEEFAFRVAHVQEIIRPQRMTRIPKAGAYLLGITSLRGKIIPVIDLGKVLFPGGKPGEEGKKQKVLILKGSKGPVGVLIDSVVGVIRPPMSGIVDTPAHLPEEQMKFIDGVAIVDGRFISILQLEEVVTL